MSESAFNPSWLPALALLEDAGGDWEQYLAAIYEIFKADWIRSKSKFDGRPLRLKRHPLEHGKEATFWHFISEGNVEVERVPDIRRCERIGWPKWMVVQKRPCSYLHHWQSSRKGETRHLIALPDYSYLFVLADRGDFLLPWTAFPVSQSHQRNKLAKEHADWTAKNKLGSPS
jgi:hypothetical protein